MILHSFTSEGFVLARRNFGEADRIIDIYSKEKGKISLIAKGVRRPKSRKRGHLEIFSKISFQAVNGKGMGILTEAETLNSFPEIRKSIKKVALAYYFMEVVGKIIRDEEKNIEFYEFLDGTFERVSKEKGLKKMRYDFVVGTLKILGYWPKDKDLPFPDEKLEEVIERQIASIRVGKRMLE